MTTAQRRAIQELSKPYLLPPIDQSLDLVKLFPNLHRFALEVGFGDGEALVHLARANPDTGYLGIEVYTPGIAKCLLSLHRLNINNVLISKDDVRDVLALQLPPKSLNEIFIHFPDPWPKRKHKKRRLIQPKFVDLCVSRLLNNGRIIFVSDSLDYSRFTREQFVANAKLELLDVSKQMSCTRIQRPQTRYEKKALKRGDPIYEFVYQCRHRSVENKLKKDYSNTSV